MYVKYFTFYFTYMRHNTISMISHSVRYAKFEKNSICSVLIDRNDIDTIRFAFTSLKISRMLNDGYYRLR